MKFLLKRRLNPFLLVTTVIVLSLLAGLSIIYQTQFDDLMSDKQGMQEELEKEKAMVEELESKLGAQNEEIAALENRTEELQEEIEEAEASTQEHNETVESLQNRNEELESELTEYRDDFDTIRGHLLSLCDQEENLQDSSETVCETWDYNES